MGSYVVHNKGYRLARNIEVGIVAYEGDKIRVLPDFGAVIESSGNAIVNVRILVSYLNAGESFTIAVNRGPIHAKPITEAEMEIGSRIALIEPIVPSVSYLRSTDGLGQVKATKFDLRLTSYKDNE